jgi:hypothetical protein
MNKNKYPILFLIVRKYLQIPATSAFSERFFFQSFLIINKQRNRLNKETFQKIILLKNWGIINEETNNNIKFNNEEENLFII